MINKLVKKLLPAAKAATVNGDGDCLRFEFFDGEVGVRFNLYQGMVNHMWIDHYDLQPLYLGELDATLKREFNNALSAEGKAWLETSVEELGE